MGLKLLVGPANAGKVSQLLERYLSALDREPILIVPTGSDVERVERELVAKQGCVFGGTIGTFDDVFERVAADGGSRRVATEAQQQLVLRRAVARASLNGLSASELAAIDGQLADLPAGGSLLGVLGIVLVVLIILDMVGVTNVFSKL